MLGTASDLYGVKIRAQDGDAGQVRDIYFDGEDWVVRYLVVDTGGWLAGREVLISPVSVVETHWEEGALEVSLTKSQVENSPDIDLDKPVSRQQVVELHEYYGWPAYWSGSTMMGTTTPGVYPMMMAGIRQLERELEENGPREKYRGDPRLRSARFVSRYRIRARDGEIGTVDDYLISEDWVIRYLSVDTGGWLGGRKVLVMPSCVERIDSAARAVDVTLGREQVETSPEFDANELPSREYEVSLHEHYDKHGYWCE